MGYEMVGIKDEDVQTCADAFVHFNSDEPTYVNGGFVGHPPTCPFSVTWCSLQPDPNPKLTGLPFLHPHPMAARVQGRVG